MKIIVFMVRRLNQFRGAEAVTGSLHVSACALMLQYSHPLERLDKDRENGNLSYQAGFLNATSLSRVLHFGFRLSYFSPLWNLMNNDNTRRCGT